MLIGVTGHQNIPEHVLPLVETGVVHALQRYAPGFTGLSSLAAGADQLFAEITIRMGGHLRVILPSDGYETTFKAHKILGCFRRLLGKAEMIETLDYPTPSEEAFLEAGRYIVDLSDLVIAVWDGDEARGLGGTADIVRYARQTQPPVVVV